MSALPGHDRLTEDDAREEARDNERQPPSPGNVGPGRDLLAELLASVESARQRQERA